MPGQCGCLLTTLITSPNTPASVTNAPCSEPPKRSPVSSKPASRSASRRWPAGQAYRDPGSTPNPNCLNGSNSCSRSHPLSEGAQTTLTRQAMNHYAAAWPLPINESPSYATTINNYAKPWPAPTANCARLTRGDGLGIQDRHPKKDRSQADSSRWRSRGSPGPSRLSSSAVRPLTAIIKAAAGPRISAPLPQDRSLSVPCNEMPHSRPRGTKPNGHGPVRKSSASATCLVSGSNGRLRGILMSPPWIKISAKGASGPNTGGLKG